MRMLLAKNCYKKDNLKTGKTIKLGTLYEYRDIESDKIVDDGEGKYSFVLNFDGTVEIEPKWFNFILQGVISVGGDENQPRIMGRMSAAIENLHIIERTEKSLKIRDTRARIHREALNGFIFCVSRVRKKRDAIGLFPNYDDCWYMTASKAHSLGIELSKLLRARILSGRHSGNHIVDQNISLENLSIYCRHEPVSYLSREVHISDASDFTIEHFMKKISDMAFVKPPSFSTEKEYRFSFTIVAGEMILMPTVKNVILNAEHLVDWTV